MSFRFIPPLLLRKCVVERLVVFGVEGRTIDRKLDDVEVLGVFFERVNVCAGDDVGVVPERTATKCAKYQDVNALTCGNIQDVLCAGKVKFVKFVAGDVYRLGLNVGMEPIGSRRTEVWRGAGDDVNLAPFFGVESLVTFVLALDDNDVGRVDEVVGVERVAGFAVGFVKTHRKARLR